MFGVLTFNKWLQRTHLRSSFFVALRFLPQKNFHYGGPLSQALARSRSEFIKFCSKYTQNYCYVLSIKVSVEVDVFVFGEKNKANLALSLLYIHINQVQFME